MSLSHGPQTLTEDFIAFKEFNVINGKAFSPVRDHSWGVLKPGKRLTPPKYVHRNNSAKGIFAWTSNPQYFHFAGGDNNRRGQMWKVRIRKGTRVVVSDYSGTLNFKIRAERLTLLNRVNIKSTVV